jgi:general secretion pathway protein C
VAAEAVQSKKKWVDQIVAVTSALLLVTICYLAVRLLFFVLDDQYLARPTAIAAPAAVQQASQSDHQVDPARLALWHLMGKSEPKPVANNTRPKMDDAPPTTLQLELRGVFVAANEADSLAIIAERNGENQRYRIGDAVPGNAALAAVFADRVLLNIRGKMEALYFPDGKPNSAKALSPVKSSSAVSAQAQAARDASTRRQQTAMQRRTGAGQIESMIRGTRMPSPDEVAQVLREELTNNASGALAEMGLEQNNGRGYKVSGSGSPLFSALGARPGDVILTVNGRPLGNPESDVMMLDSVMSEGRVIVQMERNGRTFNAEVPLEF